MPKHAFLIIAHDNFSVLERLLKSLSHPDIDVYLHIDAKVKRLPDIDLSNPHIHLIKDRVDTRWGDVSQIETEYRLLMAAFEKGNYAYYHIISGVHFPLKPIGCILDFFKTNEGNTVFYDLCQSTKYQETRKLRRFNILTRYFATGPAISRRLCQILNRIWLGMQGWFKLERNKGISFHKAANWASFTEDAVNLLIEKKLFVMKVFRHTFCGDEYFAPTVLLNSDLKYKVVNCDNYLKQEMGEANPRVFVNDDYENLINSGYLFARKFNDENIDVVDRINQHISI